MNRNFLILILLVVLAGGAYLTFNDYKKTTQENCSPESCDVATTTIPIDNTTNTNSSVWKSVYDKNLGISYKYIDNLYINGKLTEYVHPVEWPPKVALSTDKYVCHVSGSTIDAGGLTYEKTVDDQTFCVNAASEGAAGSVYTNYTFKKQLGNKVVSMSFVIRAPQCGNFDEPQATNCNKEKQIFNVDRMMAQILATIKQN
jgi:hypothetical protein